MTGSYRLRCETRAQSTEQDRLRERAGTLTQAAVDEFQAQPPAPAQKTVDQAAEAQSLWEKLGDRNEQAYALLLAGNAHRMLSQHDKTLTLAVEAANIFHSEQNATGEADALRAVAVAEALSGHPVDGLRHFRQVLVLAESADDLAGQTTAYADLGATNVTLGNQEEAIQALEQGVSLSRRLNDRLHEASAMSNLGWLYNQQRLFEKGAVIGEQAVAILHDLNRPFPEGTALLSLGDSYVGLGEYKKAMEVEERSLTIRRTLNDLDGIGQALDYLADAEIRLGRYDRALARLEEAEKLEAAANDTPVHIGHLEARFHIYLLNGQFDQAESTALQALAISRERKEPLQEADIFTMLADLCAKLGQDERALSYANQAVSIYRGIQSNGAADPLQTLGEIYFHNGQWKDAAQDFAEMLRLVQAAKSKTGEAAAAIQLARVSAQVSDPHQAAEQMRRALTLARDSQDPLLEGTALTELGIIYIQLDQGARAREVLRQALELYRKLKSDNETATVLYQLARVDEKDGKLTEARAEIEESRRLSEALRRRLFNPATRLSWFATVQDANRLHVDILMSLHRLHPDQGYDALAFEAAEHSRARSLLDLLREGGELTEDANPEAVAREKRIAQQLDALDAQQVKAGFRKSWTTRHSCSNICSARSAATCGLWAESLRSFVLASGEDIDVAARRVYNLITARSRTDAGADGIRAADHELPAAIRALSRLILDPVLPVLGTKRLAVVSDGTLDYVPFSLLTMLHYEIVSLPSASTLAVHREELRGRKPAVKIAAIFADPVFSIRDERLGGRPDLAAANHLIDRDARLLAHLSASANQEEIAPIPRLPFTRREADLIASLIPAEQRLGAIGFAATRQQVMNSNLADYRYVHFATHGWLDSQHPEQSAVVLSLLDERGNSQDGFLRASDVYRLKLSADLVTLSACQTGLGRQVEGEGLVGLTRAFLYAGAARVVVSDWNVSDEATAILMASFYRGILQDHLSPAAALRAAQMNVLRNKK